MNDGKEVPRGKFIVINTYNIKKNLILNKQPTFTVLLVISQSIHSRADAGIWPH
jgi:hypothetical protein